jgi:hypothetical protein
MQIELVDEGERPDLALEIRATPPSIGLGWTPVRALPGLGIDCGALWERKEKTRTEHQAYSLAKD